MEMSPLISISYCPLSGLKKQTGRTRNNKYHCAVISSTSNLAHIVVSGRFDGVDTEGDFISRLLQSIGRVFCATGKTELLLDLREFAFPFGREMALLLRFIANFREGDAAILAYGDGYRSLTALWHTHVAPAPFCVPIFRSEESAVKLIAMSRPKPKIPTDLLSVETKIAV